MNAVTTKPTPAARLEQYLHDNIPLVQHMQIRVASYDEHSLVLTAPLAANINHTMTAFGGSIAALATLACWGVLWLMLEPEPGLHIVVHESHLRYLRPVTDTLIARCELPDSKSQQRFRESLHRRGKARLELSAQVIQDDTVCTEFTGTFVAFRESDD
jgi:thioesterase domain-containing protein